MTIAIFLSEDFRRKSWYDKNDEADSITQCTTQNIRYSGKFREFMFTELGILH